MSSFEKKYKKILLQCLTEGEECNNRTGINTFKLFNKSFNINLNKGFPIVTGKKIFFDKALAEFRWMFEGRTDISYLNKRNVKWWNDYTSTDDLGKVYGHQIRNYNDNIDQIEYATTEIKNNSRRAIINLWNPSDLQEQALPCCFTQFNFVRVNNKLNMSMNFRSSDLFLGLPYDIIVGALFLTTMAEQTNLLPNYLGINLIDAHIYKPHIKQTLQYCKNKIHKLPILQGKYESYSLLNYNCNNYIKAELIK
jgi:thymidylate synthase